MGNARRRAPEVSGIALQVRLEWEPRTKTWAITSVRRQKGTLHDVRTVRADSQVEVDAAVAALILRGIKAQLESLLC